MSVNNRVGGKIEAAKLELKTTIENKIDDIKPDHTKNINFLNMKISKILYYKNYSYSKHPSANVLKFPLLNSPEKYSHVPQFTKHFPFLNLEGDTQLQILKWWGTIISESFQSLSTNNSFATYKSIK